MTIVGNLSRSHIYTALKSQHFFFYMQFLLFEFSYHIIRKVVIIRSTDFRFQL